jgi:hypothetical protein
MHALSTDKPQYVNRSQIEPSLLLPTRSCRGSNPPVGGHPDVPGITPGIDKKGDDYYVTFTNNSIPKI